MSLDAIRWALDQPVGKSSVKFVLVAMADCVNAEGGEMLCWPSYRFLTLRTSLNLKTVEAAVYRLKEDGLIVDTGKRRGETGKVVVYRLNTPENGVVTPGPHRPEPVDSVPPNDTGNGVVMPLANHPKFSSNPPKNGEQSPQKVQSIPPKTGSRTRKNQEGTGKESGRVITSVPGVSDDVFADWMIARKRKPVTETALNRIGREGAKAGLTLAEAVIACAEFGWQGFNAGWYADRVRGRPAGNEPAWRTEQRQRTQQAAPGVAVRDEPAADFFIDADARRLPN